MTLANAVARLKTRPRIIIGTISVIMFDPDMYFITWEDCGEMKSAGTPVRMKFKLISGGLIF